ncbi:SH3 domain-containing protein [Streptomyces sp. ISL-98]|nr:SH3 domain-containing protein [Streptomyces sp. ISL-98]
MKINKSALSSAVALGLITPLLGIAMATPAVANAACGSIPSDKDSNSWRRTGDGANQRTGSSTNCAITGQVQILEVLDYHCYTNGNDGYTWTFLRNDHTGRLGWVRDNLLSDNGSTVYCGF